MSDLIKDHNRECAAFAYDKCNCHVAEIERLKAAFMELCKGLEAQLGPGTPTEWVAKIDKLQAVIDSFPKLPGREWTADQILVWLEQVHDWKKAAQEK